MKSTFQTRTSGAHNTPLTRETYEMAIALPGEIYLFEFGDQGKYVYALNVAHGLWYNVASSKTYFQHGDYCLTDVNHIKTHLIEFVFRYKDVEDIPIRVDTTNGGHTQWHNKCSKGNNACLKIQFLG